MHEPQQGASPSPGPAAPAPDVPASPAPWLWTALGLGLAGCAVVVLVVLHWEPLLSVDSGVARGLHHWALARPGWTETARVFSDRVWDPVTMRLLIAVAAVLLWLRGEWLPALWCVATAAAGAGVQQGLKVAVGRERPRWRHPVDSAHYAAMPSGHAMTAAVTCVLLVWLVHRSAAKTWVRALASVLACVSVVGVSLTRLVLGVHWLTDTLAGVLLGTALATGAIGLWNATAARSGAGSGPTRGGS